MKDLKKLVAAIPADLDENAIDSIEISPWDDRLVVYKDAQGAVEIESTPPWEQRA